ncbi:hypothetical protein EVJ58_g6340 [Rhodofomes roseus]|uniref:Uncharacterized protein n=1 Tax=Rhodofomes roseus TaxID=34475 RepID=A0A4Y9YAH8_9APHY|nr:hypothetical protein EVJ58_g6340 [Rhodofomes roseus]
MPKIKGLSWGTPIDVDEWLDLDTEDIVVFTMCSKRAELYTVDVTRMMLGPIVY